MFTIKIDQEVISRFKEINKASELSQRKFSTSIGLSASSTRVPRPSSPDNPEILFMKAKLSPYEDSSGNLLT